MTHQHHRGILRAVAATDPNAVMAQLSTAFASFKDRHQDELAEQRAAIDELNARLTVGGLTGGGRHERLEDREHADAFASWLRAPQDRGRMTDLAGAEAAAMRGRPHASGNTLTGSAGGFAVPEPVSARIQERILDVSPLRRLATNVAVTSTGTKFLVNRNDAASAWVGETAERTGTAEPTIDLRAPSYGTVMGYVEATEELLLDSAVDIRTWFTNAVAQQIAQAEGAAFVSGNGTNKPTGFLAGPTPVTTGDATRASGTLQYVPTGEAAAIDIDSLFDIFFALKAQHRASASWLMSSATGAIVAKLRDAENRSFWQPSLSADAPNMLLGRPVYFAEDLPAVGANTFPIAFGNWEAGYLISDSGGLRITIDDNITKPGFVKFYVRRRVGGIIYDSEAIKLLKVAAS